MGNYSLTLAGSPAYSGVKTGDDNYIRVPQGTTTEQFKEYLKEYEPDTFEALEKIAKKHPPKRLSPEEREKIINNTRLGNPKMLTAAPKPQQLKRLWQEFEGWFTKVTGKNHVTADDICDAIDKGSQIWDLSHATPQTYVPDSLPNS